MQNEHIKQGEFFKFDYLKCLRSDFAKNECMFCIELCPENAMVFDRGKLTLDANRCTGCTACIGSCPTEALISETFDPNRFILEFSKSAKQKISCKEDVPCLAALSSEHLASAVIRKNRDIACDMAHCEGCHINRDGLVLRSIEAKIDEARNFLGSCGMKKGIEKIFKVSDNTGNTERRNILKKMTGVVKNLESGESLSEMMSYRAEKVPLKRVLLKNSLKLAVENFPENIETENGHFFFVINKKIDKQSCTNCQECVVFCPTEALSVLHDGTGIIFQMGKCIACSICNDVCEPQAMESCSSLSMTEFAFDRVQLLVKHEFEICEECNVAFLYTGGDKICGRCRDFKESFSDLFVMAKDME